MSNIQEKLTYVELNAAAPYNGDRYTRTSWNLLGLHIFCKSQHAQYKDTYEVKSRLNVLLPESKHMELPAEPLPYDQWNANSFTDWTATQEYLDQDDVEEELEDPEDSEEDDDEEDDDEE